MKKLFPLIACCSFFVLFSCTTPSGVKVTETFPVERNYSRLYVSDGMIVTVTDEVDDIVITGDENVMEKLKVEFSSSGLLRIFRRDVSVVYLTTTEVLLPYNDRLKEVDVEMDSEFYTPFGIEGDNVKVILSGRSKFDGYVYAENDLKLTLSDRSEAQMSFDVGSTMNLKMEHSKADLEGYTPRIFLEMKDKSSIERHWSGNYFTLECDGCYGSMTDGSTAHLHCYDEISVALSNESFIYFTGDPDVDFADVDETSDVIYNGDK